MKKNKEKRKDLPDKITIPVSYPDYREEKTNITCPSTKNVIHNKEWIEENKL